MYACKTTVDTENASLAQRWSGSVVNYRLFVRNHMRLKMKFIIDELFLRNGKLRNSWLRSQMDKLSDYESEESRFKSWRGRNFVGEEFNRETVVVQLTRALRSI